MLTIDLVPDLGIPSVIARAAFASLDIVDDAVAVGAPRMSHVELTLVSGKVYKGKSVAFKDAEAAYGKLEAKVNATAMGGSQSPATMAPAARPPRTPDAETRVKALAAVLETLATVLAHSPTDQALVASAILWVNSNWDLILTGILGPSPAPVPPPA